MASDLGALGEVVSDRTLVLNLIRGLNERFANIGLHLRRSQPFPSFLAAKEALRLEELTFAHQAATPTALFATQIVTPSPAGGTSNSKGGGGSGSGGAQAKPSKSRRSKRGGGGTRRTPPPPPSSLPVAPGGGGSSLRPGQHTGTRGPGPSRCGQAHVLPKPALRSRLSSNSRPCSPTSRPC